MRYIYSFSVWPDETKGFSRNTYWLFDFLKQRVEMDFTEKGFEEFRADLDKDGLTLREIERTPYQEPESVP